jgi:NAD-dependent deacetylase
MSKKNLVVLTGAGISAESGLKTFRDSDGLWEGYDVREVATPAAFARNPQFVLDFYNMRRHDVSAARPNAAHIALAELEKQYNVTIITQNIDDLHERAGSSNVLHLHGEIFKMRSVTNAKLISEIRGDINVGDLATDGGQLRPHIVWFDELVPMIEKALEVVPAADIFVVIGTSLLVYPAASLIHYAPTHAAKYIIDRSIPFTGKIPHLTVIEKPATEGVKDLQRLLEMPL